MSPLPGDLPAGRPGCGKSVVMLFISAIACLVGIAVLVVVKLENWGDDQ